MDYVTLNVEQYRGLEDAVIAIGNFLTPVIGMNATGKTTLLQGMAHFDYRNDPVSTAWFTRNRYSNDIAAIPVVRAEIQCTKEEIERVLSEKGVAADDIAAVLGGHGKLRKGEGLSIQRKLPYKGKPEFLIERVEALTSMDDVARFIIEAMPQIFYIEDFADHSVGNLITGFPQDYSEETHPTLSREHEILKRMFEVAGLDITTYFALDEPDLKSSMRQSIAKVLVDKIARSWKEMSTESFSVREISISEETPGTFRFSVEEEFEGNKYSIPIEEQSTGFRYFYNFCIQKCFGPSSEGKYLLLIDEPGSFLHFKAQSKLLDHLVDLSKSIPVIYSTHSQYLLDPSRVNIASIHIATKTPKGKIKIVDSDHAKDTRSDGSLGLIEKALELPATQYDSYPEKVIITEGITDYYFWKMAFEYVHNPEGIGIIPGQGAKDNRHLISIGIGISKSYAAVFDGDTEGYEAIELYKGIFCDEESRHWLVYKTSNGKDAKLENILSPSDNQKIKSATGAPTVKKAYVRIFFDTAKKAEFWKNLDEMSKKNIRHNIDGFIQTLSR